MLSKSILKVAVSRSSLAPLTAVQTRGFARPGTPKGSKSGRGADSEGSERKREDKRLIEAFNKFIETAEASKRIKPDFTDEELAAHAAIHKRYHSELRKQQNAFNKDLADKAWLQQEAMRSLPLHLIGMHLSLSLVVVMMMIVIIIILIDPPYSAISNHILIIITSQSHYTLWYNRCGFSHR